MDTLSPQYEPGRHDDQLLIARTTPADPYTTWLEEREAERRAAAVDPPRFTRRWPRSTAAHDRDGVLSPGGR
jgi:hypothetical protein